MEEEGTVCHNYSRGRRHPLTASESIPFLGKWVGRQDIAVWGVAVVTFFTAIATAFLFWWQWLRDSAGLVQGGVIAAGIFVGAPFIAASAAATFGLEARNLPPLAARAVALLPIARVLRSNSRDRQEHPSRRLMPTWVIDEPNATPTYPAALDLDVQPADIFDGPPVHDRALWQTRQALRRADGELAALIHQGESR